MAQVALSMPAFLGYHLRECCHYVEMEPVHFIVESLWIPGSLGSENLHRVLDVPFLLCGNRSKGLAETSRGGLPNPCVACNRERFEHDFLNNQTGDEVALRDRTH